MNAVDSPSRRLRTLLDCLLILLLILVLSAQDQLVLGQVRQPLSAGAQAADSSLFPSPALVDQGLANEPQPAGQAPQDNNTLAAMIAAENAALTLPQYLVGLPVVTR
jgi:hypothetical protein